MPSISIVYGPAKPTPSSIVSDAREVNGSAFAHGREIPVFVAASIVLEMDVPHQMLHLFELVAGIGTLVVIADVAGIKIEANVGMIDVAHQERAWPRHFASAPCEFRARGSRRTRRRSRRAGAGGR